MRPLAKSASAKLVSRCIQQHGLRSNADEAKERVMNFFLFLLHADKAIRWIRFGSPDGPVERLVRRINVARVAVPVRRQNLQRTATCQTRAVFLAALLPKCVRQKNALSL